MVSALYQSKIDAFQSQLAALQTKIDRLTQAQLSSEGAIASVKAALQQVAEADPDEVASLKAELLALFSDGSDGDGNGGLPITPAPITPAPQSLPNISPLAFETLVVKPAPQLDHLVLDGKSTELACLLEDCPESALVGQVVEIMCPITNNVTAIYKDQEQDSAATNLFNLIPVSLTVAYMRKNDGEISCAYAGFSNKNKAKQWGEWLAVHHSVASGFEVREAKRLTEFKHELKLWGMSLKQIERLAGCDLTKNPPSNYGDAPKRKVERVPSMLELEDIGVGDTVRSITVKNWTYKVVKVNSDGLYECDRIGANPPISQILHPGSVELVSKADVVDVAAQELEQYLEQQAQAIAPVIDPTDVPRGVILHQTTDDFIVEFNVFAWVIVRNQGVPEAQQRQIGRLVEGLGKIESYRPKAGIYHAFTRTMDAVNYLISGSGYSQANIDAGVELYESRQQKVLVGVGASQEPDDADF